MLGLARVMSGELLQFGVDLVGVGSFRMPMSESRDLLVQAHSSVVFFEV